MASIPASAPAQAAGTQANVPPEWTSESASTSSVPRTAASGWPPAAKPLPRSSRSGRRSQRSAANIVPHRPMPVCTSSRIMQPAEPPAERCHPLPERIGRNQDPALTGDRLDQDARDLLGLDLVDEQPVLDVVHVQRVVERPGPRWNGARNRFGYGAKTNPATYCGADALSPRRGRSEGRGEVGGLAVVLPRNVRIIGLRSPPGRA